MNTVLFFKASESASSRLRLAGAKRAAKEMGVRLIPVDAIENNRRVIPKLIDFWHPAGVIIDSSLNTNQPKSPLRPNIPTIYLELRHRPRQAVHSVHGKRQDIARVAAQELLTLDCSAYAYVGYPGSPEWALERGRFFKEIIELHGRRYLVFKPRQHENSLSHSIHLRDWLAGLPKPCGVFAANDMIANLLLNQCTALHLRVPNDIAIVGVDNDETICLAANPPLTSVMPDTELLGYEAMKLLWKLIRNPRLKPVNLEVEWSPTIVQRASSRIRTAYPYNISKAISLIREKACEGLRARDVIAILHGSRRSVEQAFRDALGHSILDEIQSVRMDRARELLASRTRTVETVAHLCGYTSVSAFCKQYRKAYDQTPAGRRQ